MPRRTYGERLRVTYLYALVLSPLIAAYFMWREDWPWTTAAGMVGVMLLLTPLIAARRYWIFDRYSTRDPRSEGRAAARAEAERQLPDGWQLGRVDREIYGNFDGKLSTWGVAARGSGEAVLAVALSEEDALRHVVRAIRDGDRGTRAWIPRFDLTPRKRRGSPPRLETPVALPPGWEIWGVDDERYSSPSGESIAAWGVAAMTPTGEQVVAIALSEQDAVAGLQEHAQGDLAPSDHWIVRL